ncbi:MAG: transglycosylase domain-containing protein [Clostridia bacterium]
MKIIKKLILFIILVLIVVVGIYTASGYAMYKEALSAIPIDVKIEEIKLKKNYTTFDNLPKTYIDAVIAVEDNRFYKHNGVDVIGIARAIINDIRAGELKEGGSTITQQLAKNIYFTQSRELTRKIAETFMALRIERECSKEEIFELYVNTSYFGDGYYCVGDASQGYFGKDPIDMTDYESTLLAGIPNAPSIYAPTNNFELATQRQRQVINRMVECEYLTSEEAEEIYK